MKVNFETERLVIRPLVPDDAEAVFRWGGDPAVNRYMIYPLILEELGLSDTGSKTEGKENFFV